MARLMQENDLSELGDDIIRVLDEELADLTPRRLPAGAATGQGEAHLRENEAAGPEYRRTRVTMALLYRRQIKVDVAGFTISEPRIVVELEKQIDSTQDRGEVSIYNLRDEHEGRIRDSGGPITVSAGYPETTAIIFDGEVQRVIRTRKDKGRITRIKVGDQVRQKNRIGGVYSDSLSGPYPIRRIVPRIVTAMNGGPLPPGVTTRPPGYLALGPLDAIPAEATVTNWHWGGQPADAALTALLARVSCTWFEEDRLIRINRIGLIQSDAPAISVSPQTELIGRVNDTDEGYDARMFLNPAVRLGSPC